MLFKRKTYGAVGLDLLSATSDTQVFSFPTEWWWLSGTLGTNDHRGLGALSIVASLWAPLATEGGCLECLHKKCLEKDSSGAQACLRSCQVISALLGSR